MAKEIEAAGDQAAFDAKLKKLVKNVPKAKKT